MIASIFFMKSLSAMRVLGFLQVLPAATIDLDHSSLLPRGVPEGRA
jgi:hypothetical protein